jgi:hypothetical protein
MSRQKKEVSKHTDSKKKHKAPHKKEPSHESPAGCARYATDEDIRGEFHEVQRLASGGEQLRRKLTEYGAKGPSLSGGDVDAAWEQADIGEETVGGSSPTPDQDVVADIGKAVGLPQAEDEPLNINQKLEKRDSDRCELDPASSEDYPQRAGDIPPKS